MKTAEAIRWSTSALHSGFYSDGGVFQTLLDAGFSPVRAGTILRWAKNYLLARYKLSAARRRKERASSFQKSR